jgi:hypothetical protein
MWDGNSPAIFHGLGTGAAVYHRIGFCPSFVKLIATRDSEDTDGNRDIQSTNGISLCAFTAPWADYLDGSASAPSAVEPGRWYEANGIIVGTSCKCNANGLPYIGIAYPMSGRCIRAVHDGPTSSNTFFQDSSIDFHESGVEGGGTWIIINITTNDNYAYIDAIQRPAGQTRYCRLTTTTSAGGAATTAADFDTGDVCLILPLDEVQYPLSGIGVMT